MFFITRSRRAVRASDCAAAGHSFRNVRSMLGKGKINSRRVTMDPPARATIVQDRLICLWKSIDVVAFYRGMVTLVCDFTIEERITRIVTL